MQFITIFQVLEWMKKNGYDTSFYDNAEYQDDFLDFLYFFRDGNVFASYDGGNQWLFIEVVLWGSGYGWRCFTCDSGFGCCDCVCMAV